MIGDALKVNCSLTYFNMGVLMPIQLPQPTVSNLSLCREILEQMDL